MTTRKSTEERRSEIADAAIRIIGERGLREFTAAKLAEEVGIKDGTIFRHFKDKHEIMTAVIERLDEMLVAAAPRPTGDPIQRLEAFLTSRIQAVASQPGLLSLIFSDQLVHAMGEEGQRHIAQLRNQGRDFLRSNLREAVEKNLLPQETDIESAVFLINGLVMSILFASKDGALDAPIEQVARRTWQTLRSLLERKQVSS